MKMRWEGWCDTAVGGAKLLFKIYHEVVELMPVFRATDVVSEMISRYGCFLLLCFHSGCLLQVDEQA
jgi:hypothetical protein